MNVPMIRALLFDTFGTVMNWRESIIDDFRSFGRRTGTDVDWEAFVDEWKTAWHLGEEERIHLNRVWHRLRPWPDAVAGLERLKRRYVIAPLSNSDLDCLVSMAKYAGLPWDVILCAELFRHYKPDPEVYLQAIALLNLAPSQVMIVAAHNYDLRAARSHGMATAFVPRPTEYGPGQTTTPTLYLLHSSVPSYDETDKGTETARYECEHIGFGHSGVNKSLEGKIEARPCELASTHPARWIR